MKVALVIGQAFLPGLLPRIWKKVLSQSAPAAAALKLSSLG